MRSLLLDTQALLWFLLDDRRLSAAAREGIAAEDSQVFISPASLWEIAIKISLGKYELSMPFVAFWEEQLSENEFTLLPISISHAAEVTKLPFHHRDPFDRLIIAQAIVQGIPVASSDEIFDRYGVERVW